MVCYSLDIEDTLNQFHYGADKKDIGFEDSIHSHISYRKTQMVNLWHQFFGQSLCIIINVRK